MRQSQGPDENRRIFEEGFLLNKQISRPLKPGRLRDSTRWREGNLRDDAEPLLSR